MSRFLRCVMESYSLSPLPIFGVEVTGIDLKRQTPPEVVDRIKRDVTEHRLMVFRDQGLISGDRQVEISQWFGELDSVFRKHPRSPHPDVFRVSNDPNEGCTGVGRTGWHIDGTFREMPYSHSLYHIHSAPREGDTAFTALHEIILSLTKKQRERWSRLYMLSDMREGFMHPLIWPHPVTKKETLCFHLGMTDGFVYDYGLPDAYDTSDDETKELFEEIHSQITREEGRHIYHHKWMYGDFIISDNLAVGHEATPQTQYSASQVGLRILHRTTVKGVHRPGK